MSKPFYNEDLGKLLLRVTCAGLLLMQGTHGVLHGIDHVKNIVKANGLPEFIAYGNIVGEFVAPIFMIIGFKSRLAALIVAFNMFMSIILAHRDIIFATNNFGGWEIQLNVFYMVTAIAVFFAGAGKYSLSRGLGKWD